MPVKIWALIPVTVLAACSVLPLPDRSASAPAATPSSRSSSSEASASPGTASSSPAAEPARPFTAPGREAPIALPPLPATPAYSNAVAARFPAPAMVYSTPGLQPGRNSFSSPAEVHGWLRERATIAGRRDATSAALLNAGKTRNGDTLEALVLTRATGADAAAVLAGGRPTVMILGPHTADGPAATEALLVIARELAEGSLQSLLEKINVIVVPRADPAFASGPLRATPERPVPQDHLRLDSPEARAIAALVRDYRPAVMVDTQEYAVLGDYVEKLDALQKSDALVQYASTSNLPEFLTKAAEEWFRRPLQTALVANGLSTEWYGSDAAELAGKKISRGSLLPDSAANVYALKNTVTLVVATRGADLGRIHLQRRVHTQVVALSTLLSSSARRADELNQLLPYLDKEVTGLACKESAVVHAAPTSSAYTLLMLDPATGMDKPVPVSLESAFLARTVKTRVRPCGYWLSAASAEAVERLRLHGVQVQRATEAGSVLGDTYSEGMGAANAREPVPATSSAGAVLGGTEAVLSRGVIDVTRGSFYVPMNQVFANLVFAALEPDTPTSYFSARIIPELAAIARVMAPPQLKLEDLP